MAGSTNSLPRSQMNSAVAFTVCSASEVTIVPFRRSARAPRRPSAPRSCWRRPRPARPRPRCPHRDRPAPPAGAADSPSRPWRPAPPCRPVAPAPAPPDRRLRRRPRRTGPGPQVQIRQHRRRDVRHPAGDRGIPLHPCNTRRSSQHQHRRDRMIPAQPGPAIPHQAELSEQVIADSRTRGQHGTGSRPASSNYNPIEGPECGQAVLAGAVSHAGSRPQIQNHNPRCHS